MATKSKSGKKPKLTDRHSGNTQVQMSAAKTGSDSPSNQDGLGATPQKHKMSFAQHQHELQRQNATSHK
jgi:hypothetical protein